MSYCPNCALFQGDCLPNPGDYSLKCASYRQNYEVKPGLTLGDVLNQMGEADRIGKLVSKYVDQNHVDLSKLVNEIGIPVSQNACIRTFGVLETSGESLGMNETVGLLIRLFFSGFVAGCYANDPSRVRESDPDGEKSGG